jgi:hypothetical protein
LTTVFFVVLAIGMMLVAYKIGSKYDEAAVSTTSQQGRVLPPDAAGFHPQH